MQDCDEQARETRVPREPDASLSEAILRISASLDLGTVLREVVDTARLLTRARYAIIATIDEAGQPQEFVASGFTPDEQRLVVEGPPALRFFKHLRDLPGPLRLTDLPAYSRSLGHAPDLALSKTFQAMPMRHRGVHVGAFFLAEKEGGLAFTADDEQIVVLFASQAAAAIVNAHTHRDEQRARADVEALVETSPVGVVVAAEPHGRLLCRAACCPVLRLRTRHRAGGTPRWRRRTGRHRQVRAVRRPAQTRNRTRVRMRVGHIGLASRRESTRAVGTTHLVTNDRGHAGPVAKGQVAQHRSPAQGVPQCLFPPAGGGCADRRRGRHVRAGDVGGHASGLSALTVGKAGCGASDRARYGSEHSHEFPLPTRGRSVTGLGDSSRAGTRAAERGRRSGVNMLA